jgi:hypothetical protein
VIASAVVCEFIMIFGGIAVVFSSLERLLVELCWSLVVYCNCRWNCGTVQLFMMIVGGIVSVFIRL